jgi:hypothetical protein
MDRPANHPLRARGADAGILTVVVASGGHPLARRTPRRRIRTRRQWPRSRAGPLRRAGPPDAPRATIRSGLFRGSRARDQGRRPTTRALAAISSALFWAPGSALTRSVSVVASRLPSGPYSFPEDNPVDPHDVSAGVRAGGNHVDQVVAGSRGRLTSDWATVAIASPVTAVRTRDMPGRSR